MALSSIYLITYTGEDAGSCIWGFQRPGRVPGRGQASPLPYTGYVLHFVGLAFFGFGAAAEEHADGGAFEAECFAEAVFQVAIVGEVDGLGVVDEEDEGGWVDSCLGGIVDFESLAAVEGGVVAAHGFLDDFVEAGGGDAEEAHVGDIEDGFEYGLYVVAGFGGGEDDGCVGDEF